MQVQTPLRPDQCSSIWLRFVPELAFGAMGGGWAILLSLLLDAWAPEVGAFALIYPLILIGTLQGHCWGALIASTMSFLWGWWHIVPPRNSFDFVIETGPALVMIHAACGLITLVFAFAFRRTIDAALVGRDREIARGTMLMRELEHRTKNNFALVASLLQTQKRQEGDERIREALDLARSRIHSFARAYANLAQSQGDGGCVGMKAYLTEVVSDFADGGFADHVTVRVEACDCSLPGEVAVGIGLFVNEALTNSAKHAFPEHRQGHVVVRFTAQADRGWELTVEDDGRGFDSARQAGPERGTGSWLMQAFALQANASCTVESSCAGTRLRLTSLPSRGVPSET
jgi:two-component sensor histidine kinase